MTRRIESLPGCRQDLPASLPVFGVGVLRDACEKKDPPLGAMSNVAIVLLFFFLIGAILGMNLFQGTPPVPCGPHWRRVRGW